MLRDQGYRAIMNLLYGNLCFSADLGKYNRLVEIV